MVRRSLASAALSECCSLAASHAKPDSPNARRVARRRAAIRDEGRECRITRSVTRPGARRLGLERGLDFGADGLGERTAGMEPAAAGTPWTTRTTTSNL